MISDEAISVLLVEDNPGDVRLIREALGKLAENLFELKAASRLSEAKALLEDREYDIVLLDLTLPDSVGIETLERVRAIAPSVPVVVLTGLDDEAMAVKAVAAGAQDYLVKGRFDPAVQVRRAVRYAIERHRLRSELKELSITDELTGLHNRRGFETLVDQQLKQARRGGHDLLLVFTDIDDMKKINDEFGHAMGDQALRLAAEVLRRIFRESDIIVRYGGDEFVVLAVGATDSDDAVISQRFRETVRQVNEEGEHPFRLAMSVGVVHPDPKALASAGDLIAMADEAMYTHKEKRHPGRFSQFTTREE